MTMVALLCANGCGAFVRMDGERFNHNKGRCKGYRPKDGKHYYKLAEEATEYARTKAISRFVDTARFNSRLCLPTNTGGYRDEDIYVYIYETDDDMNYDSNGNDADALPEANRQEDEKSNKTEITAVSYNPLVDFVDNNINYIHPSVLAHNYQQNRYQNQWQSGYRNQYPNLYQNRYPNLNPNLYQNQYQNANPNQYQNINPNLNQYRNPYRNAQRNANQYKPNEIELPRNRYPIKIKNDDTAKAAKGKKAKKGKKIRVKKKKKLVAIESVVEPVVELQGRQVFSDVDEESESDYEGMPATILPQNGCVYYSSNQ